MARADIERIDDQGMAAWDGHDAEGFANLFADDFVLNDVAMPEPIKDKMEFGRMRRRGLPHSRTCR